MFIDLYCETLFTESVAGGAREQGRKEEKKKRGRVHRGRWEQLGEKKRLENNRITSGLDKESKS